MTSNEAYIGKNVGQLKDITNSNESNIITNNIKLDSTQNQTQNSENDINDKNYENQENSTTNTFWLNNPVILFDKNAITELWPLESMTREQKINAITRLVIILTLIGFYF